MLIRFENYTVQAKGNYVLSWLTFLLKPSLLLRYFSLYIYLYVTAVGKDGNKSQPVIPLRRDGWQAGASWSSKWKPKGPLGGSYTIVQLQQKSFLVNPDPCLKIAGRSWIHFVHQVLIGWNVVKKFKKNKLCISNCETERHSC